MYDTIRLTEPKKSRQPKFDLSITSMMESAPYVNPIDELYMEAVFTGGKESVMPLVETIQKIKDLLDEQTGLQDKSVEEKKDADKKRKQGEPVKESKIAYFNPKAFWRNQLFKDLEDQIGKIFGFRSVQIQPYIEKYSSKDKMFESKILNAEIYHVDRFPIEGLVTDKGFYDKSRSVVMEVYLSLGLIKALTAEEILAVLLHEFGHSIDPALVDIKYIETNILSKYLTDRKHAINKNEKKFAQKVGAGAAILCIGVIAWLGVAIASIFSWIREKILGKDKIEEERLNKIRKIIEADKSKFSRQEYSEAFADNFARMYGFGPQLMSAFRKLSKEMDREMKSRFKKESERQKVIIAITEDMIKDVHKTDIHRARALINEYKADIADPNISPTTKKQLQEDLDELEKVLNEYLNDFDEFQNRVNKLINEELQKIEAKAATEAPKKDEKEPEKKENNKPEDKPKEEKSEEKKENKAEDK